MSWHGANALIVIAAALGASIALGVQACGIDRREGEVELTGDQRRGGLGQLVQGGRDEPQPAQRADRGRDREAAGR